MPAYSNLFEVFGLKGWCQAGESDNLVSMSEFLAKANGTLDQTSSWDIPFPSLDVLHEACRAIPRTRDFTGSLERLFLALKNPLKVVLDPLTQPLSWAIDGALWAILALPWWIVIPLFLAVFHLATRSLKVTAIVASVFGMLAFVDHYTQAMQTLAIILVCTVICVILGIPIGISMARSDRLQRLVIPVLDMLQTLPTFVYLIPLIFLFSVTESKLYGIAIILYAIVPAIRLTDLGIRLVDKDVLEAADAFGMSPRQKLFGVQIPLALPTIMAGVNQTIMMSLAMVVIASLVSAPGLGGLVLRGINKLELGVGIVAGLAIVMLAIVLDRVTKAAIDRVNRVAKH